MIRRSGRTGGEADGTPDRLEALREARGGGAGAPARSAVISVGEELLLGETVNTNAAWLGRRLAALGVPVFTRFTVGDERSAIQQALRRALAAADVVVTTGGLGPTPDDRTKEAVADLLGLSLELDEEILDWLAERFRDFGYDELPESNRSQARVPEGAEALPNPHGTAPGLLMDAGRRTVVVLPGVPREMKGLWLDGVEERLRKRLKGRLRPALHRLIRTTGIAESALTERVEEALPDDTGPVTVAYLPDVTGVDLRLTARGAGSREEAERWLDRVEASLEDVVSRYRYASESGDFVEAVAALLTGSGRTLATAESCTGGLVAKRITDLPGSSEYFLGGVVSYANASKMRELGVDEELLEAHGAVSGEVARAMVRGVVGRFGADCGLSITGVAGPGGGTDEKPVGTVHYAVSVDGRIRAEHRRFPGDRSDIRERSAQAALWLLHRSVREARGAADG